MIIRKMSMALFTIVLFLAMCCQTGAAETIKPYVSKQKLVPAKSLRTAGSISATGQKIGENYWDFANAEITVQISKPGILFLEEVSSSGTGEIQLEKKKEKPEWFSGGKIKKYIIPKKGTYALKAYHDRGSDATYSCNFRCWLIPSENTTLKSGEWTTSCTPFCVYPTYEKANPWYKIVVPKDGYLKFEMKEYDYDTNTDKRKDVDISTAFCNSKKKEYIEQRFALTPWHPTYVAVKKGTYYFKSTYRDQRIFAMKYTFVKKPASKNTSMKKAYTLSRGKKAYAVVYSNASESTVNRFYKIKLKKAQKVKIHVIGEMAGAVMRDSKGKGILILGQTYDENHVVVKTSPLLKAGTYYILPVVDLNPRRTGTAVCLYWD